MPELPEVETVCRGLSKAMKGRKISGIRLHREGLRIPFPPALAKLRGVKVTGITRRAKYILIALDDKKTIIVHLGMSGRMTVCGADEKNKTEKHDHMVMMLDDGCRIVFNDPRRFGLADLAETKALETHRLFKHLGVEPMGRDFTPAYLAAKLKGKKISVKLAIMDQRVVVGVGNIYASEALFSARIDPRRAAGSLTVPEIKKLTSAICDVLARAIKAGGSSLRDYVQADGELGYFQHHWAVYGKEGEKCRSCTCVLKKTGGVHKITQGGRSTFYCPVKQNGQE